MRDPADESTRLAGRVRGGRHGTAPAVSSGRCTTRFATHLASRLPAPSDNDVINDA